MKNNDNEIYCPNCKNKINSINTFCSYCGNININNVSTNDNNKDYNNETEKNADAQNIMDNIKNNIDKDDIDLNDKKTNVPKLSTYIVIIIAFGIFLEIFNLFFYYDNYLNSLIHYFSASLFLTSLLLFVRKKSNEIKKICLICLTVFFVNFVYFYFFSMIIEPLIYLNVKYDISYFDMRVSAYRRSSRGGWFDSNKNRMAIIMYNDIEIYVYYETADGWTDRDHTLKDMEKRDNEDKIYNEFKNIINNYTDKYKIITNINGFKSHKTDYTIFLNTNVYDDAKNIIYKLDELTVAVSKEYEFDVDYYVYIVNDDLYDKLVLINKYKYKKFAEEYYTMDIFPIELFAYFDMNAKKITSFDLNDYFLYSNYGNNDLFYYYEGYNKKKNLNVFAIK